MSGLVDKRKRSREDDDFCESTPLSKRINNIHLSNYDEDQYNQQIQYVAYTNNNNHMPECVMVPSEESSSHEYNSYETDRNLYDPELNESQNPFYYLKNKLLYDLHLERLKRSSI